MAAKMTELMTVLEKWARSFDSDEEMLIGNEIENRVDTYVKEHFREITKTNIVKINIDSLEAEAVGSVPGGYGCSAGDFRR